MARAQPLALLIALGLSPAAAWAGTAVGESIWDRSHAIQQAMQSVPAGAKVTSTDCQEVEVGTGNYHYLCQVTYSDPPSQPATGGVSRGGWPSAPHAAQGAG